MSSGKLSDKYELTDVTLGSGAFGVVKVAHLKDDENQLFAVKIIPKTNSLLTEEEFLEVGGYLADRVSVHFVGS